jgi:hypothetical protein
MAPTLRKSLPPLNSNPGATSGISDAHFPPE